MYSMTWLMICGQSKGSVCSTLDQCLSDHFIPSQIRLSRSCEMWFCLCSALLWRCYTSTLRGMVDLVTCFWRKGSFCVLLKPGKTSSTRERKSSRISSRGNTQPLQICEDPVTIDLFHTNKEVVMVFSPHSLQSRAQRFGYKADYSARRWNLVCFNR